MAGGGAMRAQNALDVGRAYSFEQAPKTDGERVARLQKAIESAEKAMAEEDVDAAAERLDEAEAQMADWPNELLKRKDVIALLERMNAVKDLFSGADGDSVKSSEKLEPLTADALRSELALVESAEADTAFDFPIDLNDKVLAFIGAFSGRSKEKIEASLSRGTKYIPMIHQVLLEEGLPLDLAYLPLIESGFRNVAVSRAKAVGMWQFISATGKTYGLRIDNWVDERRDPAKATRAAARFLKYLYELTGDWYLALAGYNAGPGAVSRATNGTDSRNFWDHARSRYLWSETKNYVPQFCAAVLVGKHPDRFGLSVEQLEPFSYEVIEIEKSISLTSLAQRTGIDVETLKELNPELLRRTTPPRLYSLKVPVGKSEEALDALAAIPATERIEFRSYKIQKGDTLAKVAARYKTTPEELLDINNIPSSQFKVGRTIQVPVIVQMGAAAQKK